LQTRYRYSPHPGRSGYQAGYFSISLFLVCLFLVHTGDPICPPVSACPFTLRADSAGCRQDLFNLSGCPLSCLSAWEPVPWPGFADLSTASVILVYSPPTGRHPLATTQGAVATPPPAREYPRDPGWWLAPALGAGRHHYRTSVGSLSVRCQLQWPLALCGTLRSPRLRQRDRLGGFATWFPRQAPPPQAGLPPVFAVP